MSLDGLTPDDLEVRELGGGKFTVRIGRLCIQVTREELVLVREALLRVARHFQVAVRHNSPDPIH